MAEDFCIFCGLPFSTGRKRSQEHVWPEWMHELLPDSAGARQALSRTWLSDEAEPHLELRELGGKLKRKLKPRVACEPCNNNWMSQLEERTKPILKPLILGKRQTLSREKQRVLATWFCLKNMVAEYTDPATRATSSADRRRMYREQLPPPRTSVWIGEHAGDEWTVRYRHHGLLIAPRGRRPIGQVDVPPMNTQIATLAAGRVIFHLLSRPAAFPYTAHPGGAFARKIAPIYPVVRSLKWPVGPALTDADASDLGDRMLVWIASEIGTA